MYGNSEASNRPWERETVVNFLRLHRPQTWYAAAEIDVTATLQRLAACRRELGAALSLHGVIVYCLAQSAVRHPDTLTYRYRNRLVTFRDADVATTLLKKLPGGGKLLTTHTFRAAQNKSAAQIQWELRSAMRTPLSEVPQKAGVIGRLAQRWRYEQMRRNPFLLQRHLGNLMLTNLQSPGLNMPFNVLPPNPCTLTLAAGSISEGYRPDQYGQPSLRKLLSIGGASDHAVIDGYPLSQFTVTLTQMLENGAGLDEDFITEMKSYLAEERQ